KLNLEPHPLTIYYAATEMYFKEFITVNTVEFNHNFGGVDRDDLLGKFINTFGEAVKNKCLFYKICLVLHIPKNEGEEMVASHLMSGCVRCTICFQAYCSQKNSSTKIKKDILMKTSYFPHI